jgi:hypothetical protein
VSATLARPRGDSISGSRSDYLVDVGDLYPNASLKWNRDVHNVMIYATAGVPVGAYNPTRLATMGLAHWATDTGVGYTYYNEQARFEWSAVIGLTYNFINPYTQYQSGTDAHLDWAISPYVGDKVHVGAVGYVFNQLTGDSGAGARLGEFKSRVAGVGPQIGFFFPVADRQGYLNFRVRCQKPACRMDRVRHVFDRGAGTKVAEAHQETVVRRGSHPPSRIATPTSAAPTATIASPVVQGRSPP